MSDRPFGWRPPSEEQIDEWRKAGFDEATIEKFTNDNVYRPVETSIWGLRLAISLLRVSAQRLGADFVEDVKADLAASAARLEASDMVEDNVEAPMVTYLVENFNWSDIIEQARTKA